MKQNFALTLVCPHCHLQVDGHEETGDGDGMPDDGSISVCYHCWKVSSYVKVDGEWRLIDYRDYGYSEDHLKFVRRQARAAIVAMALTDTPQEAAAKTQELVEETGEFGIVSFYDDETQTNLYATTMWNEAWPPPERVSAVQVLGASNGIAVTPTEHVEPVLNRFPEWKRQFVKVQDFVRTDHKELKDMLDPDIVPCCAFVEVPRGW